MAISGRAARMNEGRLPFLVLAWRGKWVTTRVLPVISCRSGERRGGEEWRSRGAADYLKKKKKTRLRRALLRSRATRCCSSTVILRAACTEMVKCDEGKVECEESQDALQRAGCVVTSSAV